MRKAAARRTPYQRRGHCQGHLKGKDGLRTKSHTAILGALTDSHLAKARQVSLDTVSDEYELIQCRVRARGCETLSGGLYS